MRNALAVIGLLTVVFCILGATGLTEFRYYVGPDPKGFCERTNK